MALADTDLEASPTCAELPSFLD